jgi:hypothetical protein
MYILAIGPVIPAPNRENQNTPDTGVFLNKFEVAVHRISTKLSRTYRISRLRSGNPTAHETSYLPLLPSGPDGVHRVPLRGTQSSTPLYPAGFTKTGLAIGIKPCYSGLQVTGHRYLPV